MTTHNHIIVWTARVKLAALVAAAVVAGACTSNGQGIATPASIFEPGIVRPTAPLRRAVSGRVLASTPEGQVPVEGALVEASRDSAAYSAVTDAEGRYVFESLAIGWWTIVVQKDGYRGVTAEVDLTDSTSVDFLLRVDSAEVDGAESEGSNSSRDRR